MIVFYLSFFLIRIILVIPVLLGEITLTISDSTAEPDSMVSEIVRMVFLSTAEISEITRLKSDLQGPNTLSATNLVSNNDMAIYR